MKTAQVFKSFESENFQIHSSENGSDLESENFHFHFGENGKKLIKLLSVTRLKIY